MKLGIVICTYNRPEYLRQVFDSLQRADIQQQTEIVVVDDCSTDAETLRLIKEFQIEGCKVENLSNAKNSRIVMSLMRGFDNLCERGCEVMMNLDSDALVRNDFIHVLMSLHMKFPDNIVSGFHSLNTTPTGEARHPVIGDWDTAEKGYLKKKTIGGINMMMSKKTYETIVKPNLQQSIEKGGNWDHMTSLMAWKKGLPMIVSVPSVVQHIGFDSSMNHNAEPPDVACDFKHLHLPDVTLIGVDCVDEKRLEQAAKECMKNVKFASVKLLSSRYKNQKPVNVGDWQQIAVDELSTKGAYSKFIIKELTKYVDTKYALIFQHDGYVTNYKAWSDEFLKYDYVGATWWYKDGMNVGNGGFSIRSKKLLNALAKDKLINQYHPEDHHICRTFRSYLEQKHGIRYAPEKVADRFSVEGYNTNKSYTGQFGFHGHKMLPLTRNKKKTYIVNQFQGLGDILFTMPMMEDWVRNGNKVILPVVKQYVALQKHFPKITFIDKSLLSINYESRQFVEKENALIIPLRFSDSIVKVKYQDCMKSKYMLFGDDWRRWRTLTWQRDYAAENELFYNVLGLKEGEAYNLVNKRFRTDGSGKAIGGHDYPSDVRSVLMQDIDGYTLLDWGKVIEKASRIYTAGTSINYVIEILDCMAKEIHLFVRRPEEKDFSYYDYILSNKYKYVFHK